MKQIIVATFVTAMAVSPVSAQNTEDPSVTEGFNLMEEGAKLLLRGLMAEIEPALDEMGDAMDMLSDEMGPALAELLVKIDDMRNYEPPEVLSNGDIIIRRSDDAPDYAPAPETGEIDL